MKLTEWLITVNVQYDQEHLVKVRLGIKAITKEIALIIAGQRVERKMKKALIVDAYIVKDKNA